MSRKNWASEKIFSRLLNNRTQKTYWDNINELRSRPNQEVFNKAMQLAKSKSDKEKNIGIAILAQLGFDPRFNQIETIKLYFELLTQDQSIDVLISILYAISHNFEILTEKQVNILQTFKNNESSYVRTALANAISCLQDDQSIDTLILLSKDTSSSVRNWATFSLGTLIEINNKKITDALWKRVDDKHQETKLEAILGLAIRKDNRVKEIVRRELKYGEYGTLLFEAIEQLNDKDFLPLLEDNLQSSYHDDGILDEWILDLKDCISKLKNSDNETHQKVSFNN